MEIIEEYYCTACAYLGDAEGILDDRAETLTIICPICDANADHDPEDYGHFLMAIDRNVCGWQIRL